MRNLLPILLTILAACAHAANKPALLNSLGKQLHVLRSLPKGEVVHARCPGNISSLSGASEDQIHSALGTPNYVEDSRWSYFLTSPAKDPLPEVPGKIEVTAGGGFPVISFSFGANQQVISVSCSYAR
jgi:hypothetical protein